MDAFIEKIVTKRKGPADLLVMLGIATASALVGALVMFFGYYYIGWTAFLLTIGSVYLGYRLTTLQNVEFEYLVTNDSLDVDKIVSQRKRKRIFSSDCKSFEAVARVHGQDGSVASVPEGARVIFAGTRMDSKELYYVLCHYQGKKTVLYFEPDQRMLDSFRRFIPRKVII